MWLPVFGALSFAIWIYLVFFRGDFWRADQKLPRTPRELAIWPEVVAIVPARNEAAVIDTAVQSLLNQDYPGRFSVILIDDESEDATADRARATAEALGKGHMLLVARGGPLPEGWAGKVWAMEQGRREADRFAPDARFLLFTDADIAHAPGNLKALVAKAEGEAFDLVSLMVRLRAERFWERLMLPAFVFFFQMLYPFPWVNDPMKPTAAAAGGCMLARRAAVERIGGLAAIQNELIDDCALARRIKEGGPVWLGLTETTTSLRAYDGLNGIWNMVARTAYTELRYSPPRLAGTLIGMTLTYLTPPVLVLAHALHESGAALAFGFAAWALMMASYRPSLKLYGTAPWVALFLPVVALLYCAMTLDSARRHWQKAGGAWKGRPHTRTVSEEGMEEP
ncbi:MAG: glycosyltransferase [Alphaproteobacteria bacterium]|nr:glycosyltransferase [Alphaproteobacteria bacterium]